MWFPVKLGHAAHSLRRNTPAKSIYVLYWKRVQKDPTKWLFGWALTIRAILHPLHGKWPDNIPPLKCKFKHYPFITLHFSETHNLEGNSCCILFNAFIFNLSVYSVCASARFCKGECKTFLEVRFETSVTQTPNQQEIMYN